MTSKDLNLNFDQSLADRAPAQAPPASPKLARKRLGPATAGAASNGRARRAPRERSPRNALLAACKLVLLLANILALAAAGYWLYFNVDRLAAGEWPPMSSKVAAVESPTAETAPLAGLLNTLDHDMSTIDARLEQLQLTLHEQRQLFNSALLDLEEQLTALQTVKTAGKQAAGGLVAADRWVINAGTFVEVAGAERLMGQLLAMGYEARLGSAGKDKARRVQITGFADRAAAETAARQIVGQTDLNGLWVWKDD